MSEMFDTEDRSTFFPIMHGMLSQASTPEESHRCNQVLRWVADHREPTFRMFDRTEQMAMEQVVVHWYQFGQAPSRQTLEELVRQLALPEEMLELLATYDKWQPQLPSYDLTEFRNLLRMRFEDWTSQTFLHVTQKARIIATSGLAGATYKDPVRKGVRDARKYLITELFSDVFQPGGGGTGGPMSKLADRLMEQYGEIEEARLAGNLGIPTGIPLIDDAMGGLSRRTLNLILGTAGHRKSAVARTIAYYAALAGFRTLFICLEWPYEEEVAIFAMMHAHNYSFSGAEAFSIRRFREGLFNRQEKEAMQTFLVPALKQELGDNLVIKSSEDRTFQNIRQLIEVQNSIEPLDLVVIDYIGMFDLGKGFDKTYEMHEAVRQLKQLTLHLNDDKGLVVVSPVQGSRKGYEEAVANQGIWEKTGIFMFGEMEKSADNILYCFQPDELKATNQIKLGFCKTRRHGTIAPLLVEVDPQAGIVGGSPVVMAARAERNEIPYIADLSGQAKVQGKQGAIKGKRQPKPKPTSDGSLSVAQARRLIRGAKEAWR